jgi:hypothetical protein
MSATTIFLGKLLGLYLIAISAGMLTNKRRTLATLDEMARSGPWMLFSGMVATAASLAVVLARDVWSGGALTIAVTLARCAALLKDNGLLGMTLRYPYADVRATDDAGTAAHQILSGAPTIGSFPP